MSSLRSFLFLLFSMLVVALVYLSVLVTSYEYAAVKSLGQIQYSEWGYSYYEIELTESDFNLFRTVIYSSLGVLLILGIMLTPLRNVLSKEWNTLYAETKKILAIAKERLRKLKRKHWLLLGLMFVGISVIKFYFLLHYPLHTDETATYDYFVMEGIEAVTGFYPFPNNHVLQNVLNWISYQISPGFYFSVRGTAFLIGTLGLLLLFLLFYIATNFRTAVVFVLLMNVAYLPFYYTINGRGYAFLLILAGLGFISTYYALSPDATVKRLSYLTLTASSILGLYTVPTYLYAFATYIIILAAAVIIKKQYGQMLLLTGIGGVVGLVTLLLYTPVLVISGPEALFANRYVTPAGTAKVMAELKEYSLYLEASIVGQERLGHFLVLFMILLTLLGLFTDLLSPKKKLLCVIALAGIIVPYLLFLLQGVLPPHRTIIYKAIYVFLLMAIVADTAVDLLPRYRRVTRLALVGALIIYAVYEIHVGYTLMKKLKPEEERMEYIWTRVTQESPSSMYISDPFFQLFFLHYAKVSGREISFFSDFDAGKPYDILILKAKDVIPHQVLEQYTRIYDDNTMIVYTLN